MQLVLTDDQDVKWNLAGRELHCDVRLRFNNAQADNVTAHYQLVTGKLQSAMTNMRPTLQLITSSSDDL